MITLTLQDIERALPKVQVGLVKYCWLQDNLYQVDVSADREFQRRYNGFYRVRRNAQWQWHYFALLERSRAASITFEEALSQLLAATGRLEASFASKLVATINPNLPVIDKFVLENLGLRLPRYSQCDRKTKVVEVYDRLISSFHDFAKTDEGNALTTRFQEIYPEANLTTAKMIDLVLWQTR